MLYPPELENGSGGNWISSIAAFGAEGLKCVLRKILLVFCRFALETRWYGNGKIAHQHECVYEGPGRGMQ
jgi:hypothetical protein